MSNKRILHLVETWRPVTSGYTSRSWELVTAIAELPQVNPVVLVTSRQYIHQCNQVQTPPNFSQEVSLIAPSPLEQRLRSFYSYYTDTSYLQDKIDRFCQTHNIDAIHSHWSSGLGMAAASAAQKANIPLIAEVRFDLAGAMMSETIKFDFPLLERTLRFWFERHLQSATGIVAASYSLAQLLTNSFPEIAPRLTVVPNGVDHQQFYPGTSLDLKQQLGLEDKIIVGSTSNMLRYEGLDLLLEAIKLIRQQIPNIHLVLVGTGTQEQALKQQALKHNLPVTFVGKVSPDIVPDYLRMFDIFAIPRRNVVITRYASPIKLTEAMACGLAIVSSDVGDIGTMLGADRGVVVPPESLDRLAQAIVTLATDSQKRSQLGQQAHQWAKAHCSWQQAADVYKQIYTKLD